MSILNTRRILIKIDQDTPTYRFGKLKTEDVQVRVSIGVLERWKKVMAAFDGVQKEMEEAVTPSSMVSEPPRAGRKPDKWTIPMLNRHSKE